MWDEIQRLKQRLLQVVVQGIIKTVIDSGGIQVMQLDMGSGYIRDNTLRVQEYGFSSNPPAGSYAVLLSAGGNITDAVVVATDNPKLRPKNLADGESQMYDNVGKMIYLSAGGIIIDAKNTPVTINNATTVTINASTDVILNTPLLKVSGDIIDNYASNNHTVSQMRGIFNAHVHSGVQSGGSNTGPTSGDM